MSSFCSYYILFACMSGILMFGVLGVLSLMKFEILKIKEEDNKNTTISLFSACGVYLILSIILGINICRNSSNNGKINDSSYVNPNSNNNEGNKQDNIKMDTRLASNNSSDSQKSNDNINSSELRPDNNVNNINNKDKNYNKLADELN